MPRRSTDHNGRMHDNTEPEYTKAPNVGSQSIMLP